MDRLPNAPPDSRGVGQRKKLTRQQREFCHRYVVTKNAMQAAKQAGYSDNYAQKRSYALVKEPAIQDYIKHLEAAVVKEFAHSAVSVMNEFGKIAFVDATDFFERDSKGHWVAKDMDQLTPEQRAAVKKVTVRNTYEKAKNGRRVVTGQRIEYEVHDKMLALTQLGRHYGVFEDRVTVTKGEDALRKLPVDKLQELQARFRELLDRAKNADAVDGEYEEILDGEGLPDVVGLANGDRG